MPWRTLLADLSVDEINVEMKTKNVKNVKNLEKSKKKRL